MAHYKLLCLDIDGTLHDSHHNITPAVRTAVCRAHEEKNMVVALASGRISSNLLLEQQELGITGPLIAFGGAYVIDGEEVLLSRTLSADVARKVLAYTRRENLTAFLYRAGQWYAEKHDWWYDHEEKLTRVPGEIIDFDSTLVRWERENTLPNKVLVMSTDTTRVTAASASLSADFTEDEAFLMLSGPKYLEVMPPYTDKGTGILCLADHFGLEPAQIMSIGDYYNDLGMFRDSGFAVAMGNAPQGVKDAADYVTASHDEDGVAAAIEKLLLEEK